MRIVSRSEWGARSPTSRRLVDRSRRRSLTVHYDGTAVITRTGPSVPQAIQRYHMDSNGWSDIGYNFVIDQAGMIFEGRGWDTLGAHAGSAGNVEGIGVQVAIGGSQQPSDAALRALLWLKGEADRLMSRTLVWRKHLNYVSTSCPGKPLSDWIDRGCPAPGGAPVPTPIPLWDGSPVPGKKITTPYGLRGPSWSTDRNAQGHGIHTGDDYAASEGTPVVAVVSGTVTVRDDPALGCMSILKGDNGRFYWYCHLKRGSRDPWRGERVVAGQKIAEVGQTGNATGPHLHLEDCTSATVWRQGLRKPEWPAAPASPPTPEDDMPAFHDSTVTFAHPGPRPDGNHWAIPAWEERAADALDHARIIDATAQIHVPEGVGLYTRWVSYSKEGGWVRYAATKHTTRQAETSIQLKQAGPGADLRLDVWVDRPCDVWLHQSSLSWNV